MFIRRKKNRSGTTSIIVVDKSRDSFKEIKIIGTSADESELASFYHEGQRWIAAHTGERDMFTEHDRKIEEKQVTERLLNNIESILLNGTQLILNQVFRLSGFGIIGDDTLKNLVIARICEPRSKVATVDYLKSYFDEDIDLNKIYRYLDKLHSIQQEKVQHISVEHTRKILGGKIGLVFYDVTTLYFETDASDELRERGFSKDGKHAQPQVVLGLLVSRGGYPLSYSLFNGSRYEGRTMIPVVEDFVKRFKLDDFILVADSGLINKTNIKLLESEGYKYIIGARIKNETDEVRHWILSQDRQDGCFYELGKLPHSRLIIGYSGKRAKKDAHNRDKGVKRLQKACKSGHITKENINKRGYNKFLEISNSVSVTINHDKIIEDVKWDGLKGYLTNTSLPASEVHRHYSELWQIERAFRITKGTLELRPMFHFTPKRIEAHVCICFVACKVYKELERILKLNGMNISVDKVLDIAKTITTLKIRLALSNETMTKTMLLTPAHKSIARLFDENFWKSV